MYPAREEHGRWRAVWHEGGQRQQCEAASEEKLAARLEKVTERLAADAPDMKRPGADLIAWYLDPDRLPVDERWSRKHAHTRRRLCERFAARREAATRHAAQADVEHLALGILAVSEGLAPSVLARLGTSGPALSSALLDRYLPAT